MKEVTHSIREADRPQRSSKNQPVETRQRPRDLVPMLRDKLVHGALRLCWMLCLSQLTSYERRERLCFWCGYAALFLCGFGVGFGCGARVVDGFSRRMARTPSGGDGRYFFTCGAAAISF